MCGFVGFTGFCENRDSVIKKMADRIVHRGPDGEGFYVDLEMSDRTIALGHRRLSIIDLEAGNQPMFNEDGSVVCVFNGEIYNYKELKTQLINAGHIFKTDCDTEVLVHGFEEYGADLVYKLRGMFAFVIWDKKTKTLFGARDHFGIKPFYYSELTNGNLIFGSEIKSFLEHPDFSPKVNADTLKSYLTLQYNALDETFFKGVYKLEPAHFFFLKDGKLSIEKYWDVDFSDKTSMSFDEAAEAVDARIRESVEAHRIADVEVGAYLSGGIDSSYVTAIQMPSKTFSVGFQEKDFDETSDAQELSKILNISNKTIHISPDDCLMHVDKIQYFMDEPDSNLSSLPLFYLSELASKDVKVVLSGEGADEIYGGYDWYIDTPLMRKYKKLPASLRRSLASFARNRNYFKGQGFIEKGSGIPEDYFIGQALVFEPRDVSSVLKSKYNCGPSVRDITEPIYKRAQGLGELDKKQYLDFHMWLPGDILLKADKMSMSHSLELRVPFLDKEVINQAQSMPINFKDRNGQAKAVLRAASKMTLPAEWVNRPKKGFPVPIINWLREDIYYERVKAWISGDVAQEYFNVDTLVSLLNDHKNGIANNQRKIWTVLVFLKWHEAFFNEI